MENEAVEHIYLNTSGEYYLSTTGPHSTSDCLMNSPSENLKNLLRGTAVPVHNIPAQHVVKDFVQSGAAPIKVLSPLEQVRAAVAKQQNSRTANETAKPQNN